MKIIGEKINGTRSQVKKAVSERDADFVRSLAKSQVEAGAHWLDVNAGTSPEREPEDLVWLVHTVQEAVEAPLCLDSANPEALAVAIKEVRQTPLINSISGEQKRLEGILPLLRNNDCGIIALAMDDKGIPASVEDRLAIIKRLIEALRGVGVSDDRVYVDPLVMAVASNKAGATMALTTMRTVRSQFPDVHITSGLSNVSFGLPLRPLINRAFLILALDAGLDTPILDPLNSELRKALLAAEVVLGHDNYCLNYLRAYRAGLLDQKA